MITRQSAVAQSYTEDCELLLPDDFVSDGQQYFANVDDISPKIFHVVFYSGTTYRLAFCSNLSEVNLQFSLFDPKHNLLYSNKEHDFIRYWNFKFSSTVNCTIEVIINSEENISCQTKMLIGFQEN